MKILIAEDDPISSALLQATLTRWGFEVLAASDGRQALEAMQLDDAPRLAIVDWMMPGMDGIQLCRKLRDGAKDKPLYIMMLTAKAERSDVITGLESGADAYMTKPFDRDEFRARVQVGVRTVALQQGLADRVTRLLGAVSRLQETEAISRSAAAARKSALSGPAGAGRTLFD